MPPNDRFVESDADSEVVDSGMAVNAGHDGVAIRGGSPSSTTSSPDASADSVDDVAALVAPSNPKPEGRSGWPSAIFLIMNAALGAGLLNFPSAFNHAGGIGVSMAVQTVFLGFAIISLLTLSYCAKKYSCSSYQEVVLRTCGWRAERVCSFLIAIYCYGSCVTFLVIIGDLAERTASSTYGPSFCHHWYMTREFMMMAISFVLILPLCFPKQIDFLKYPSSFGVLAVVYIVALIIYEFYFGGIPAPAHTGTRPTHLRDMLNFVPVMCFGYQCHISSVPIYACMKDKKVMTFARAILVGLFICVLLYSLAGIYGYLTFGSDVTADVLVMYDASGTVVLAGFVALALKLVATYPILMFCGRSAFDDLLPKSWLPLTAPCLLIRRLAISLFWFASSLCIACAVPSIELVISSIGSLAALFIFVFPTLSLLQMRIRADRAYRQTRTKIVIFYCIFSIFVGSFIFGQVLMTSAWEIYTGKRSGRVLKLCN